jgi:hypothetical protein
VARVGLDMILEGRPARLVSVLADSIGPYVASESAGLAGDPYSFSFNISTDCPTPFTIAISPYCHMAIAPLLRITISP